MADVVWLHQGPGVELMPGSLASLENNHIYSAGEDAEGDDGGDEQVGKGGIHLHVSGRVVSCCRDGYCDCETQLFNSSQCLCLAERYLGVSILCMLPTTWPWNKYVVEVAT